MSQTKAQLVDGLSQLQLNGSTSGYSQIVAPAVAGNQTFTLPGTGGVLVTAGGTQTLTNKTVQGGAITSGTSVASTSGTSIDFTGIPSWVKKITVMFNGVSTNGASKPRIQLGTSGGVTTTGYAGSNSAIASASASSANSTGGFDFNTQQTGNAILNGISTIAVLNSSTNVWSFLGVFSDSAATYTSITGGAVTLSGTLDRVRITTVNGTDTFDAGSINILWEG